MMASAPVTVSGPALIEGLARTHGEPDWLRSRRLAAWETFRQTPLPGAGDEAWRRTRIGDLGLEHLRIETAGNDTLLSPASAGEGVVLTDLHTAARRHPDLLRRYLFTELLPPGENALVALNAALWRGGAFVHVPAGVKLETPLRASLQAAPHAGVFSHTLIVAGEGSRVTFVESLASGDDGGTGPLHVGAVQIFAAPDSSVTFCSLQRWGTRMRSFSFRRAQAGAGASVKWLDGEFGGGLVRSEMLSLLQAPGGRSTATVACFGTGKQHLDVAAGAIHTAPETRSEVLVRGVLADESRAVWRGIGRIHRGARGARVFQRQQALLLGPEARVDAIPALVIDENEVEAAHAAAAGPLDPEQLFYLMSRGIPETAARKALIRGFFEPLIAALPEGGLRAEFGRYLDETVIGQTPGGGS